MKIHLIEPGAKRAEIDAISVTANPVGLTNFNRIAAAIGLDADYAEWLTLNAQDEYRVAVVELPKRKLLIVPKARAQEYIEKLTIKLLQVIDSMGIKELLFTHYAFLPGRFPGDHIRAILRCFMAHKGSKTLSTIWWEIDPRHKAKMEELLSSQNDLGG